MRKSILLMLVMFLVASTGFSQMSNVKEAVTAKEKEMYEAIKSGDMDTFKANLADEFMSVYATGFADRTKELENIKNLKMDSYELSDIQVMQPAESVAIISYSLTASGMWENEKFSGKYYSTSTWVMDNDTWKAVMHTETEATPMEKPMGMEDENEN